MFTLFCLDGHIYRLNTMTGETWRLAKYGNEWEAMREPEPTP